MGMESLLAIHPPRFLNGNTYIGPYTYGTPVVLAYSSTNTVVIGKFCSIGGTTIMLGGNHRYDWGTTYPFSAFMPEHGHTPGVTWSKGNVLIGHDVWIGICSTIMSGVTVGHGACIGTGSVVTKDIPPYAIAAGNPARVVKYRFPQNIIDGLLRIQWWDWEPHQIEPAIPLLMSNDFFGLFRYAKSIGK
ncbi:CatB-related O-acetyltransferase [Paenibacillus radicis (ex Gao et al. 2016)]|uniref:Acetyltransferase n=1 Tax=Paenibacillus radicis (ex Gao et al. 2016) TaxID=1737354 RepID=A0A917M2V2_9BACL|nr:CatB-related O-acetyltransferase [Paenibacillus radicis (ex Gao et al. 2016)]GGG73455.1 acetyltransferase [Paenibacillus radicis (ex Gao et al. 2016)]